MAKKLKDWIIEGIEEKKGSDIVTIDLRKIENSFCDYFIICQGNSNTQIQAIASFVEKVVKEKTGEKILHKEGLENAQWIILDYGNILVHVFDKDTRMYYNLEELWADGVITKLKNN